MSGRILTASICVVGALISVAAFAQTTPAGPDCAAQATEKKLHGAALKSFMRRCDRDAAASACDVAATEKKLSGAARTSFTKKCVRDAAAKPSVH
ncbi:PsiF family protein [Methylocystis rosea]|uniref:PsiF repeat-containing protein n=1 Tax=Methylocystis rosea TaxID=173366 RepID=A0ABX6EKQ9_9HYPH|nr:PsiF family protein [Methylocystis rosea]PWB89750.1 hypothetical protein C5688_14090 [Methylocystis sp. MitZ-2018]QGM94982.1 hypothetical protein F7D13_13640 [Methylocystis rosea]